MWILTHQILFQQQINNVQLMGWIISGVSNTLQEWIERGMEQTWIVTITRCVFLWQRYWLQLLNIDYYHFVFWRIFFSFSSNEVIYDDIDLSLGPMQTIQVVMHYLTLFLAPRRMQTLISLGKWLNNTFSLPLNLLSNEIVGCKSGIAFVHSILF